MSYLQNSVIFPAHFQAPNPSATSGASAATRRELQNMSVSQPPPRSCRATRAPELPQFGSAPSYPKSCQSKRSFAVSVAFDWLAVWLKPSKIGHSVGRSRVSHRVEVWGSQVWLIRVTKRDAFFFEFQNQKFYSTSNFQCCNRPFGARKSVTPRVNR